MRIHPFVFMLWALLTIGMAYQLHANSIQLHEDSLLLHACSDLLTGGGNQ